MPTRSDISICRAFAGKVIALAAAGLLLTACAQPVAKLERSSLSLETDAQDALALPPPGGPSVVSVVERRFANAIQQDIILSTVATTAGQNTLRVQFFGPVGPDGGETTLGDLQPTEGSVAREMRRVLPGIAMARSPLFAQNSYGPFGYATGRSGANDLCLYAWQRIAPMRTEGTFRARGAVQVRLRLCQTNATEEGLLAIMYGYTINAAMGGYGWNPYGVLPAADSRLGMTGQPIHPYGLAGSAVLSASSPVEIVPTARPAAPRPAVVTAPEVRVAAPPVPANAPIVPLPPSSAASSSQATPVVPPPPSD